MKYLIVVILFCLSCNNPFSSRETINIGLLEAPTEKMNISFKRGVELALAEKNQQLKNKNLVFKLVKGKEAPMAILAAPQTLDSEMQSEKIPILKIDSSQFYQPPTQGKAMATFAAKDLKLKKIAVMREKASEYSIDITKTFVETFKKLGGSVVAVENYRRGDIDFKDQLTFIRARSPQAIYVPGMYKEAALVARQVKKLGLKGLLLGGDKWDDPQLFEIGRDSVNGAYFTSHFSPNNHEPINKKFVKAYRQKYKGNPTSEIAMIYHSTLAYLTALEKAVPNITPAKISANLAANASVQTKPSLILKVDGPAQTYVKTIQ